MPTAGKNGSQSRKNDKNNDIFEVLYCLNWHNQSFFSPNNS